MLSEFWQAIVGSAVISTIISILCLWWHKKNDYKRDYYKKIVDKRSISDIIKKSEWYSADVINCLRKIEEILKKGLESLRDIEEATEEEEYLQRMHAIQ